MKKTEKNILIVGLSIFAITLQSCYTSKPIANSVSSPDYNKRVSVSGAKYRKKRNALDVVFNVGLIGAGAYGGYNLDLIQQQTENGKEPVRVANAAIGALAGASVAYLIDQIAGKNKTYPVKDPADWIRKANGNYRFLGGNNSSFSMIHSSVETDYQVKNIKDLDDFKSTFTVSLYEDNVFKKGMSNLVRSDLPRLIEIFPNNKNVESAKIQYITSSQSFDDATAAINKYRVNYDTESTLLNLIHLPKDALRFPSLYPSSSNMRKALVKAFSEKIPDFNEIAELKKVYGSNFSLNKEDFGQSANNIRQNYFNSMLGYSQPDNFSDFDEFTDSFKWLEYSDKGKDIASAYWNLSDKNYNKGIDVVSRFLSLSINPRYEYIKFTDKILKDIVGDKLKEITRKHVSVATINNFTSQHPEWEKWKNSAYTAGVVQTKEEEIVYYLYGEIINNSKYDLPIVLNGKATLTQVTKAQGTGSVSNAIASLSPTQTKNLGDAHNSFYYPLLPSGDKIIYAIKLDFGEGVKNSGVNFLDWIKSISESHLTDVNITPDYNTVKPSANQLNMQAQWQNIIHEEKIPEGTLVDLFRGQEVYESVWNAKNEERKARWREFWASVNARSSSSRSSSSSSESLDDRDKSSVSNNKVLDSGQTKVDVEKVSAPKYSLSEWQRQNDSWEYATVNYEQDSDGEWLSEGTLFKNKNDNYGWGWSPPVSAPDNIYDTKQNAVDADYVWKKYKKIRNKGRK